MRDLFGMLLIAIALAAAGLFVADRMLRGGYAWHHLVSEDGAALPVGRE